MLLWSPLLVLLLWGRSACGHIGGEFYYVARREGPITAGVPFDMAFVIQDGADVEVLWDELDVMHERRVHVVALSANGAEVVLHAHANPMGEGAWLTVHGLLPLPGMYYFSWDFVVKPTLRHLTSLLFEAFDVNKNLKLEAAEVRNGSSHYPELFDPAPHTWEELSENLQRANASQHDSLWTSFGNRGTMGEFTTRVWVGGEGPPQGEWRPLAEVATEQVKGCRISNATSCETSVAGGGDGGEYVVELEVPPLVDGRCVAATLRIPRGDLLVPFLGGAAHAFLVPHVMPPIPHLPHTHATLPDDNPCEDEEGAHSAPSEFQPDLRLALHPRAPGWHILVVQLATAAGDLVTARFTLRGEGGESTPYDYSPEPTCCPVGWVTSGSKTCFRLSESKGRANDTFPCADVNGTLASFSNLEQQAFLGAYAGNRIGTGLRFHNWAWTAARGNGTGWVWGNTTLPVPSGMVVGDPHPALCGFLGQVETGLLLPSYCNLVELLHVCRRACPDPPATPHPPPETPGPEMNTTVKPLRPECDGKGNGNVAVSILVFVAVLLATGGACVAINWRNWRRSRLALEESGNGVGHDTVEEPPPCELDDVPEGDVHVA